ncbi:hypothetical protein ACWCZ5_03580 [Streptomyces sp. NPDC001667]
MYTKLSAVHTAGFGGAFVLSGSAFGTLAHVVAVTTLLMAAVSLTKILPKPRRPEPSGTTPCSAADTRGREKGSACRRG